jgi:hypothetical protein
MLKERNRLLLKALYKIEMRREIPTFAGMTAQTGLPEYGRLRENEGL